MLDIEVFERKLIDLFLSVADKTRVELEQFGVQNREVSLYYAGEITGPGTLQCSACGHQVSFTTTSHIDRCAKCGHNTFRRAEFKD
jgi:rRNA maturation endonuclease Nob1